MTWPRILARDTTGCNGGLPKIDVGRRCTGPAACPERSIRTMRILLAEDDRQLRLSIARGLARGVVRRRPGRHGNPGARAGVGKSSTTRSSSTCCCRERAGSTSAAELREAGTRSRFSCSPRSTESSSASRDSTPAPTTTSPSRSTSASCSRAFARSPAGAAAPAAAASSRSATSSSTLSGAACAGTGARSRSPRKEFAFLLHLARNAGRVVDRAELMEHVWDDAQNTYSNIIDVYASRLRRKIDDGEQVALFKTIRGTGFMLDAPARLDERRRSRRAAPDRRANATSERARSWPSRPGRRRFARGSRSGTRRSSACRSSRSRWASTCCSPGCCTTGRISSSATRSPRSRASWLPSDARP